MSISAAIMDASFSGPLISTPTIEVPATPHPHHAELPANLPELPVSDSIPPSSAQLIQNSSQESEADLDSLLAPIPGSSKRSKYHSLTPPSSSMTPPPSTQPPKRAASSSTEFGESRNITPTPAVTMSSPPATVSRAAQMTMDTTTARGLHIPSSQQLDSASTSELRQLIIAALQENSRLDISEKEARMSAAHYKLQHNLLELETEETTNRLEVEHEMMRREVEVLQQAELARRDSNHSNYSSSAAEAIEQQDKEAAERYISDLKTYAEAMAKENAKLVRRFERAKKVIADKEEDIKELSADNKRLLERIRQNREHIHLLTGQGGIYASPQSQSISATRTVPSTPNYKERATPSQTPESARHHSHSQQMRDFHHMQTQNSHQIMQHQTPLVQGRQQHHDRQDSFATLLLADRVLNDQNSAPSTPRRATAHGQQLGHGHPTSSAVRHHRAAQSLSSLPIPQPVQMQAQHPPSSGQPTYGQPMAQPPLLSPPQLGGRQSLPGPTQSYNQPYLPRISPRDRVRRRKSRDSTISASDEEERAKEMERVSPYQVLQTADPFSGYAPAQRSMVQALPGAQQQAHPIAKPTPFPRYEPAPSQAPLQIDDDETEEEHPEEVESDINIPPSQASLSASAMLRRDPRESFEIKESPRTQQNYAQPLSQAPQQTGEYRAGSSNMGAHPPLLAAGSVTEKGRVLQAKIFGSVTKPGMGDGEGKRKRLPSEDEIRAKRLRVKAREGLGLGLEL